VEGNLVGAGTVFLFKGSAAGLVPWTTISNNSGANPQDAFGSALAAADFHGDLITDLIIGAPKGKVSVASPLSGVIYIYKGKINAVPVASGKKSQTGLDTDEIEDRFGAALAAGDFNNDGRADLAVGAPGERISDTSSGKAYVFLGNLMSTLTPSVSLTQTGIETDEEEDLFGARLVASDFTGDGLADLAVSAPGEHTATGVRPGRVYIFKRTGATFSPASSLDQAGLESDEDLDGFGWASAAADWSGDGKADLALFSTGLFEGASGSEPVFLFQGTATGATSWQTLTVP
jgi:hypothetical protein